MNTTAVHTAHPLTRDGELPDHDHRRSRIGIGWIVVGSMIVGLVVAGALVAAPFIPPRADVLTAVALFGFAVGWALLAVLSVRVSDHPHGWAAAPAVFLGVAGLISLLGPDTAVGHAFGWVWPPVLLVLVVWSITRARGRLPSRARRWLVYPVLAVLAIAAVGGG